MQKAFANLFANATNKEGSLFDVCREGLSRVR